MSVRDIYENLKAAIGRAKAEKQYDIPIVLAESLGFVKRETPQPVLAFEYMYCADDGSIRFVYRSWGSIGTISESSRHQSLFFDSIRAG